MAKVIDMWQAPCETPNGLQASEEGLWAIDAASGDLLLMDWQDGATLFRAPTETYKASGLTLSPQHIWVASTHNSRLYRLNRDGSTAEYYDSPGIGVRDPRDVGADYARPHGMEWVEGALWVCVKPALRIYRVDPDTMAVQHSVRTPGPGPHGIAWDDGAIWCAEKIERKLHKLDATTGEVLAEIEVAEPELDGLTMHDGAIIFCGDTSRRVCRIDPQDL